MFRVLKNRINRKKLKEKAYDFLFEPYEGDEVVVIDTETTGLRPKVDEILSIGAVKVKKNKILTSQTFEIFLKPKRGISKKSIEIHYIRPCDLENAVEADVAMAHFLRFIGNRPLVGYYLEFDLKMIDKYIKPWLGISLPNRAIEVSGLYFDYKIGRIPQANVDLRFETMMKELNVPNMGQHNAVNDAIMTAMMYIKLKDKLKSK